MSPIRLVFDDSIAVPAEVAGLAGISSFGQLLYRRRTVAQRFHDSARLAGFDRIEHVASTEDLQSLRARVARLGESGWYLYFPSNVVAPVEDQRLADLLSKLRFADRNIRIEVGRERDWTGLLLLRPELFLRFIDARLDGDTTRFHNDTRNDVAPVDNRLGLLDLGVYANFVQYLTSNFEVRHFNSIATDDRYSLVKRSANVDKICAEFRYLSELPAGIRRFFVQPYDLQHEEGHASYRMERLLVPDMALQWIHKSLDQREFTAFLDHVFHFLALRPARTCSAEEGASRAAELYVGKLDARIRALRELPTFSQLDALVSDHGVKAGIDGLVGRFKALYQGMSRRRRFDRLVLGHGDLCFSNILYDKRTRSMKFIDPRGFAEGEDPYTDEYYDVAKLSHSILGRYDYINNGLYTISVGDDLSMKLCCDAPDRQAEEQSFRDCLAAHGFDYGLTRLHEASLFLSMLPLHAENPRKLAAFALTARGILDELES